MSNSYDKSEEFDLVSDSENNENHFTRSSAKRKSNLDHLQQSSAKKTRLAYDMNGNHDTKVMEQCSFLMKEVIDNGGASLHHLQMIAQSIIKLKENDSFQSVNFAELGDLIKILSSGVAQALSKDFDKKTEKNDKNKWKYHIQKNAEAIFICLLIFSSEDMPATLYVEDYINTVVLYVKNLLIELKSQASNKSSTRKSGDSWFESALKKVLGVLSKFLSMRNFSSANLNNLITISMSLIFDISNYDIQMAVTSVIVSTFKKRDELRAFVLSELLVAIKKLPENKKLPKNCVVGDSIRISILTVLVMTLIQDMVSVGASQYNNNYCNEKFLQELYKKIITVGGMLSVSFITQCSSTVEGHKTCRTHLDFLTTELLEVSNEPEWPASKFILQFLAKPLAEIAKETSKTDSTIKPFALKILTKISIQIIKDQKEFSNVIEALLSKLDLSDSNEEVVMRELLASYLTEQKVSEGIRVLHQLHWFGSVRYDNNEERNMTRNCDLEHPEAKAIVHFLDTKRTNYSDSHIFLNYILNSCYDNSKKVKAVGAQCLAELVNADPHLLSRATVSKTMNECLSASSAVARESMCALFRKFLLCHPDKAEDYNPYLLRLLGDESVIVKKSCINAVEALILKDPKLPYRKELCYKIFGLIRDEELSIRKQVVNYCTLIWLSPCMDQHLDTLLEIIDWDGTVRYLRLLLEEKCTPKVVPLLGNTQTQPQTQAAEAIKKLVIALLDKVNEKVLSCMKVLSVIAVTYPKALTTHALKISEFLNQTKYSDGFAVEFLTAETLNHILPELVEPDVTALISLRDKLVEKLNSSESLIYNMGFVVSLIKLLKKLSIYGQSDFLLEKCFKPNLEIMEKFRETGEIADEIASRALRIAVYIHMDFPRESEKRKISQTIRFYLQHKRLVLPTVHSLCYLSMERKTVMNDKSVREIIGKYLKDQSQAVLTRAVLFNILCSLKNIDEIKRDSEIKTLDDRNMEVTADLVQTYLNDILECALDARNEIRYTACMVIQSIIKTGIMMEAKFIPYVTTMITDPDRKISIMGRDLLKKIHAQKIWDLSRNPQGSLLMSYHFHAKLSDELLRGFQVNNGRFEALCDLLYQSVQEDSAHRKRLIDAILDQLKVDSQTTMKEKLYLIDHLACFSYKYNEEIFYLLRQLEHLRSVITLPVLSTDKDRKWFVDHYYGYYLFIPLKEYLQKVYGVSDKKILKYYCIDPSKDVISKKAQVSVVIPKNMLPNEKSARDLSEDMFQALRHQEVLTSSQSSTDSETLADVKKKLGRSKTPSQGKENSDKTTTPTPVKKTPTQSARKKRGTPKLTTPKRVN